MAKVGERDVVGRRVLERRRALGLTQEALSERAGLHRNYVGGVERGERDVTVRVLTQLAAALEVDPGALVGGDEPPWPTRRPSPPALPARRARPTTHLRVVADEPAIAIGIERLVHTTLEALRAENSALRQELDAARVRIGFLESQLHALSEAQATGHRSITKAMLRGVAAILLATSAGAAEGAVSASWPRPSPPPEQVRAADLVAACDALARQLDAGQRGPD